jgi:hypothetical protein
MRKIQSDDLSLEVVHPDAAGIDIDNESHYVAVRRFACTTAELKAMAQWLKQCGIRTDSLNRNWGRALHGANDESWGMTDRYRWLSRVGPPREGHRSNVQFIIREGARIIFRITSRSS